MITLENDTYRLMLVGSEWQIKKKRTFLFFSYWDCVRDEYGFKIKFKKYENALNWVNKQQNK